MIVRVKYRARTHQVGHIDLGEVVDYSRRRAVVEVGGPDVEYILVSKCTLRSQKAWGKLGGVNCVPVDSHRKAGGEKDADHIRKGPEADLPPAGRNRMVVVADYMKVNQYPGRETLLVLQEVKGCSSGGVCHTVVDNNFLDTAAGVDHRIRLGSRTT